MTFTFHIPLWLLLVCGAPLMFVVLILLFVGILVVFDPPNIYR